MTVDQASKAVIEECAARSHEGSISFGTVVGILIGAGVESYHADYRHNETTYYLPSGATHAVPLVPPETAIAEQFDAAGVQAAVRGAQSGAVKYVEFIRKTRAAGCVGYIVWITGRHVQYFGRRGESHIEHFPS